MCNLKENLKIYKNAPKTDMTISLPISIKEKVSELYDIGIISEEIEMTEREYFGLWVTSAILEHLLYFKTLNKSKEESPEQITENRIIKNDIDAHREFFGG